MRLCVVYCAHLLHNAATRWKLLVSILFSLRQFFFLENIVRAFSKKIHFSHRALPLHYAFNRRLTSAFIFYAASPTKKCNSLKTTLPLQSCHSFPSCIFPPAHFFYICVILIHCPDHDYFVTLDYPFMKSVRFAAKLVVVVARKSALILSLPYVGVDKRKWMSFHLLQSRNRWVSCESY